MVSYSCSTTPILSDQSILQCSTGWENVHSALAGLQIDQIAISFTSGFLIYIPVLVSVWGVKLLISLFK